MSTLNFSLLAHFVEKFMLWETIRLNHRCNNIVAALSTKSSLCKRNVFHRHWTREMHLLASSFLSLFFFSFFLFLFLFLFFFFLFGSIPAHSLFFLCVSNLRNSLLLVLRFVKGAYLQLVKLAHTYCQTFADNYCQTYASTSCQTSTPALC